MTSFHLHPRLRALRVQFRRVHAFQNRWKHVALSGGLGPEVIFQHVLSGRYRAGEEGDAVVADIDVGLPEALCPYLLARRASFGNLAAGGEGVFYEDVGHIFRNVYRKADPDSVAALEAVVGI